LKRNYKVLQGQKMVYIVVGWLLRNSTLARETEEAGD
jgi:hypothetical protein